MKPASGDANRSNRHHHGAIARHGGVARQQAHGFGRGLCDENAVEGIGMKRRQGLHGHRVVPIQQDVSRRIGLAKGEFKVPENIDAHNAEVAALFLGGR